MEEVSNKELLSEVFSYKTLIKIRHLIFNGYHLEVPKQSFSALNFVKGENDKVTVKLESKVSILDNSIEEMFSKVQHDNELVREQAKLILLIRLCDRNEEQQVKENKRLNEVFAVSEAGFEEFIIQKAPGALDDTDTQKPVYFVKLSHEKEAKEAKPKMSKFRKYFYIIYSIIIALVILLWYFVFK